MLNVMPNLLVLPFFKFDIFYFFIFRSVCDVHLIMVFLMV